MNKQLRILLISSYFHPHVGGSQRYMEEIYTHLRAAHPETLVDVLCYNTDGAMESEIYRGMNIYRIPCMEIIRGRFAFPNPLALMRMLNKLAKNKYDYVHTHLRFFDQTWWAWLYARIIGVRSIFTEHVASTPTHQSILIRGITKFVDLWAGIFVNQYDLVTSTNTPAKELLLKLRVRKQVRIFYGGVDTKYFSPKKTARKVIPKLNKILPANALVVTYVGRLIWTKGITYLMEAIGQLLQIVNKNVYFVLAGEGELFKKLKVKALTGRLKGRVFLTGNLKPDEVRNLLRITDIFVYPTHHNEGFPNSILEAGASEVLVITTDSGGTREIITPGKTGVLIEQKNASSIVKVISWALTHPKKAKSMAKKLRSEIADKFDWRIICDQFYKLIVR